MRVEKEVAGGGVERNSPPSVVSPTREGEGGYSCHTGWRMDLDFDKQGNGGFGGSGVTGKAVGCVRDPKVEKTCGGLMPCYADFLRTTDTQPRTAVGLGSNAGLISMHKAPFGRFFRGKGQANEARKDLTSRRVQHDRVATPCDRRKVSLSCYFWVILHL